VVFAVVAALQRQPGSVPIAKRRGAAGKIKRLVLGRRVRRADHEIDLHQLLLLGLRNKLLQLGLDLVCVPHIPADDGQQCHEKQPEGSG